MKKIFKIMLYALVIFLIYSFILYPLTHTMVIGGYKINPLPNWAQKFFTNIFVVEWLGK